MKNNFKVGDIVRTVKGMKLPSFYTITNEDMLKGEVIGYWCDEIRIKVLNHKEKAWIGKICYVNPCYFELIKPETIVIYRKDDKVYALDKQTGEKASAKCHRDDEFDFKKGAEIAFNRLIGKDVVSDVSKVTNDFKVGNKVKILDGTCITNYYGGFNSFMKKKVGEIHEIKSVGSCYCYLKDCGYVWDKRGLEKVSEFEASLPTLKDDERVVKQDKYKVGDRVKIVDKFTGECLNNELGHMDKYQGKVLTICEVLYSGKYKMVQDDRKKVYTGDKWVYNEHCIEGKVVKKHTFEIGDMVRLKTNYDDIPKGAIGEVIYFDSDDTILIDFKVKYKSCHSGGGRLSDFTALWLNKHQIEKV